VNSFDKKLETSRDLRRIADRRRQALEWSNERRFRPDRRLNNISVEWIPFNEVNTHPSTRGAFGSVNRKGKKAVQLREKDTGQKEPSRQTRCEKERAQIKSWGFNIFKRTQRADVEERTITDRRTKNIKQPFNRRVRADRRLNNISLEWITLE
jgi:hypothetical protein